MSTLSVVISAYNEESKIRDCLASVQWADEIIVVDNQSNDSTAEISKTMNAKVITRKNNPMLNINKNEGFNQATSEWILNLDADERITPELENEIKQIIHNDQAQDGYRIPRKNMIFGKWIEHGLWWPDHQLRLFKKGIGKFPCVHVHEYIEITGEVGTLMHPFLHENYQTVSQFIQKMDRIYTENEVENKLKAGYTLRWTDALLFPARDFLNVYYARKGYKDGLHGLVLSLLQACYALVVFAKLWEKKQFPIQEISHRSFQDQVKKIQKESNYWFRSRTIDESASPLTKTLSKIQRKVGI